VYLRTGPDNEISEVSSPENRRFPEYSFNYSSGGDSPDRLNALRGALPIFRCQDDIIRSIYYDSGEYRVYSQGISFFGLENNGGFNRADFLDDIIVSLSGAGGLFSGLVLCNLNDDPVSGALLEIDEIGEFRYSDDNGRFDFGWIRLDQFTVDVSARGYTALNEAQFTFEDHFEAINAELRLLHPVINIDQARIEAVIDTGAMVHRPVTVSNTGDGPLDFSTSFHLNQVEDRQFGFLNSFNATELLEDNRLSAVVFFQDHYWIAGGNNSFDNPNMLYKVTREGELSASWEQGNVSNYGWRDLTVADGYLYAVDGQSIIKIDPESGLATGDTISATIDIMRGITWDSERGLFWVIGTQRTLIAYDMEGNEVRQFRSETVRNYGLAFYPEDPDGYPLYVIIGVPELDGRLMKYNPDNGNSIHGADLMHEEDERISGCSISNELYEFTNMLIVVAQGGDDWVREYEAGTDFYWLSLEPSVLENIEPNAETELDLTIDASHLIPEREYHSFIRFNHNTIIEHPLWIEVSLVVQNLQDVKDEVQVPNDVDLISVFPNPFNDHFTFTYSLAQSSKISINIFDISGRMVYQNVPGFAVSGRHQEVIDAKGWASGVYVLEIRTGAGIVVRERVLGIR